MLNNENAKVEVKVLRHQIDYLGDEDYENINCNEHGGNCCQNGYCCNHTKFEN